MSVYDHLREYHEVHGDDFGSEAGRYLRYDVAAGMFPKAPYLSLLDVGCGSGQFEKWCNPYGDYTGIDLLDGQNVLDYQQEHDLIVALGVLYKVPHGEQQYLIAHMWKLAKKALIVQTLALPRNPVDEEWPADPVYLHQFSRTFTDKVALRTDYMGGDLTLALYR